MDRTRTTGKLGIVTGAGSGIGRATALRLAVELVTADVTTQKVGSTTKPQVRPGPAPGLPHRQRCALGPACHLRAIAPSRRPP